MRISHWSEGLAASAAAQPPVKPGGHFLICGLFQRKWGKVSEPPMKTSLQIILAAALSAAASAGDITIYNDQGFPRLIRLGHRGKLYGGWILPGQQITVHIDENRKGKPILMADYRDTTSSTSRPQWTFKAYPLAKKSEPAFYNMSWFPRGN